MPERFDHIEGLRGLEVGDLGLGVEGLWGLGGASYLRGAPLERAASVAHSVCFT